MSTEQWADRPPWLVQVRRAAGDGPSGAGVLVTAEHVLTCAHVVAGSDTARPERPVHVWMQHADKPHEPVPADVVAWSQQDDLDVAVLRLRAPLPARAMPAPIAGTAPGSPGVVGHAVGATGYPKHTNDAGSTWRGQVTGVQAGMLELRAEDVVGFELESGFSGGPLWDRELGGLVGIVVGRERARRPDPEAEPPRSIRVGYATTIEAIRRVWPALPVGLAVTPARLAELTAVPLQDGRPPLVAEADLGYFGVDPANPVYVARNDVDAKLDAALRDPPKGLPFVLAIGPTVAGKSRSLAEAVRRFAGERSLLVPVDGPALGRLAAGPLPVSPAGAVIWLEDADRFLIPGGLDLVVLRRLAAHSPPVVVVGTMVARRFLAPLRDGGASGTPFGGLAPAQVRALLQSAADVNVDDRLTDDDLDAASAAYEGFDRGDGRLAHHLRSIPTIEAMFRHGRGDSPLGWAMLMAAIDWRRTGVESPVPRSILVELMPLYLDREPTGSPEQLDEAIDWAVGRSGQTGALTRTGDDASYRPATHLVELAENDPATAPVALAVWEHVVGSTAVTWGDLMAVAYAAASRGYSSVAIAAAEAVDARSDDPWFSAWSRLIRAQLLTAAGDDGPTARELFRDVIDSKVPELVELAQVEFAVLLINAGEPAPAVALLDEALRSTDPDVRRLAKANLGVARSLEGDSAAAESLLEEVLRSEGGEEDPLATAHLGAILAMGPAGSGRSAKPETDQPAGRFRLIQSVREFGGAQAVHLAQAQLGLMKVGQGQGDRARTLLEAALAAGDPTIVAVARAGMGHLRLAEGDLDGAQQLFDDAIASGQRHAVDMARMGAAGIAYQRGDVSAAVELLDDLVAARHAEYGPMAADCLGGIHSETGDLDAAVAAYRVAIESGHRDWCQVARVDLAVLLAGQETAVHGVARQLLEEVVSTGHREQAPRAADLLGDLLRGEGDLDGAETAYRRAIDSGHQDWSMIARVDLARMVFDQQDDSEQARDLLAVVADSGHQQLAGQAVDLFGDVLLDLHDRDGARAAYRRAVASGDPYWSMMGRLDLGLMAAEDGDLDTAEHLFTAAMDSDHAVVRSSALFLRGLIRRDRQERESAVADLVAASEIASADNPGVAAQAAYQLVLLELAAHHVAEADRWSSTLREYLQRTTDVALPVGTGTPAERPGRGVLELTDYLYRASPEADDDVLSALAGQPRAALGREEWAGLHVRLGRQQAYDGRLADAETTLRAALAEAGGHTLEWPDEAVARRYLATVVMTARSDHDGALDGASLAEIQTILAPFLDRDDAPDGPCGPDALLMLGRSEVLLGRLARGAGRDVVAVHHFDRGTELMTRAADAAERHDDDVLNDARADLADLPRARGDVLPEPDVPAPPLPVRGLGTLTTPSGDDRRNLWRLLGQVASADGATAEARYWLRLLDPDDWRTRLTEAVVLLESGDPDAALALVDRVDEQPVSAAETTARQALRADLDLLSSTAAGAVAGPPLRAWHSHG